MKFENENQKEKIRMKVFFDLLMENGELVRVEVPSKFEDECLESIEHAIKTRGWFSPGRWDGCAAEYLGMKLVRVNMGKVVATI